MTKRIMKGVQDIKTASGRADERSIPYKAYMKLSVMEMEKYRRGKEKQSALDRVANIEHRFCEIEAEREAIIADLESRGIRRRLTPKPGEPETDFDHEAKTRMTAKTTSAPFKIRY